VGCYKAAPKVARTFVRKRERMRANVWSLVFAIAIFIVATIADRSPYDVALHRWGAALAVAIAGIWLLVSSLRSVSGTRPERFAALGSMGGVVIAVAFLGAELLVGPPQRVSAAPGQTYHPQHSGKLAIVFPAVDARGLGTGQRPVDVEVVIGSRRIPLPVGRETRVHSYVLRADRWPAAYVQAWSSNHIAQTVTQPQSASAFVSPVLQFPSLDQDGFPIDSFAVPAIHRSVRLKYYSGLPSRGIDVPFVQLEIDEENGGPLFSGVAVSDRRLRKAGMELVFALGTYPVVSIAGAPDRLIYAIGTIVLVAGIVGFAISALAAERSRAKI
jgi:hypothetical protein